MNEELQKHLEDAVKHCSNKATEVTTGGTEAMHYTQAALNAANALVTLAESARRAKQK